MQPTSQDASWRATDQAAVVRSAGFTHTPLSGGVAKGV